MLLRPAGHAIHTAHSGTGLCMLHTAAQGYTGSTQLYTAARSYTCLITGQPWVLLQCMTESSENRQLCLNLSLSLSSYVTWGNFLNLSLPQFSSSVNQSIKNLLAVRIKGDGSLKHLVAGLELRRCLKKFHCSH